MARKKVQKKVAKKAAKKVAKKAAKKAAPRALRARGFTICKTAGCRKRVYDGGTVCPVCLAEAADPLDTINKLSDLDRYKFLDSDASLITLDQERKLLNNEQTFADLKYNQSRQSRIQRLAEINATMLVKRKEQLDLMNELGEKYGFDPTKTSIDDKTGVVHELQS